MPAAFAFDNTYARDLARHYVAWQPAQVPAPRLLFLNRDLAVELGLDADALEGADGADAVRRQPRARRRRSRSRRPMPATSSAASRRSSATAARCCSAR